MITSSQGSCEYSAGGVWTAVTTGPGEAATHRDLYFDCYPTFWASQATLVVKNLPAITGDVRDMGSMLGSGRYPGGGHGNLF